MSATPPPMPPMQSNAIRSLLFVGLAQFLLQIVPMVNAHMFVWWNLLATALPITAGILLRMAGSDVQAPVALNSLMMGMLNRGK